MKIGILGGSFDPPHIEHYLIASQTREQAYLDQVWLMPCYQHPFAKNLSAASHRLAMTKLYENEHIKVSDLEIRQKTVSYTIDTLAKLSDKFREHSFSWIIGSDQVASFSKWKDAEILLERYPFIVFPKQGYEVTPPKEMRLLNARDIITSNLSSTFIRNRLKERKSISYLVADEVMAYIYKNHLYED